MEMLQIEISDEMLLSEQAIARSMQAQVKGWMAAKPDRRSTTDNDGIPVVRRRRAKASYHGR
jgi:hypothetical protein